MAQTKVLLTGASGFIATHILDILLKRGYNVVATVRTQEKANYIHKKFGEFPVETVIVKDIEDPNAFDSALQDNAITAVIHTASPFHDVKSDPLKELLNPAVQGTKNVMQAIKTYAPQVKNMVITSSYASISNTKKRNDNSFVHTEKTWADISWEDAISNNNLAYRGSKKFAELAFWDFIKTEKPNFTGTTVNPPLVYGPLLQKITSLDQLNTSSALLWKDVINSIPGDTSSKYADIPPSLWVDVRDVALAHVLPLEKPELAGQRLFVTPGFYSPQLALDVVNKNFPSLRGKIAIGQPGTGLKNLDQIYRIDNHVTNELLGIKYHTFEECIVDSFTSLVQLNEESNVSSKV